MFNQPPASLPIDSCWCVRPSDWRVSRLHAAGSQPSFSPVAVCLSPPLLPPEDQTGDPINTVLDNQAMKLTITQC